MTLREFIAMPCNHTCHKLLTTLPLPKGVPAAFGLGLDYCHKASFPSNNITSTFKQYHTNMRCRKYWKDNPPEETDEETYSPKLYISSGAVFDYAGEEIKDAIEAFETNVRRAQAQFNKKHAKNISTRKYQLVISFRQHDRYIIIEADKNLGSCILERETYTRRALEEQLGNANNYQHITRARAATIQQKLSWALGRWIQDFQSKIPVHERDYLHQARAQCKNKYARFRMSCKIHKTPDWKQTGEPFVFRPINVCCGKWMKCWSKWLDYHLTKTNYFYPYSHQ